jgi:hypothetical protein
VLPRSSEWRGIISGTGTSGKTRRYTCAISYQQLEIRLPVEGNSERTEKWTQL